MKWKIGKTQNDYFAFTYNDQALLSWDPTGVLRNDTGVLTNSKLSAPNVGDKLNPSVMQDWAIGSTSNGYLLIIQNKEIRGIMCPNGQLYSVIAGVYYLLTSNQGVAAPSDTAVAAPTAIPGSGWSMGPNNSNTGFVMFYNGSPVFYFTNDGVITGIATGGWISFQNGNNDAANAGPVTNSFYESVQVVGTDIGRGMIDASTLGVAELVGFLSPSAAEGLSTAENAIGYGIATATTAVYDAGKTVISVISNPSTWNPSNW
jgi:hypothetical protein